MRLRLTRNRNTIQNQGHSSLICELDGIVDQVSENLPQTQGITDQPWRRSLSHLDIQSDILGLGPHAHEVRDLLEQQAPVKGLGVDLKLSGLNLGEIKNVSDEIEQSEG